MTYAWGVPVLGVGCDQEQLLMGYLGDVLGQLNQLVLLGFGAHCQGTRGSGKGREDSSVSRLPLLALSLLVRVKEMKCHPVPVSPSTQTSEPGFPGQSQLVKGALQWPPQLEAGT